MPNEIKRGPIIVIGSINMDLVCRTPTIPRAGETILGSDFVTIPGGKGANQAVAAAKLLDWNSAEWFRWSAASVTMTLASGFSTASRCTTSGLST